MRICLIISYDGSKFRGFQQQKEHDCTVMNKIINACISLKINSIPVGSGRTDSRVHACNQSLHLDLPYFWTNLNHLKNTLNNILHPNIHIKKLFQVDNNFHSRFDAKARLYRYIINHNDFNPFLNDYCLFYKEIDLKKLNEALSLFEGTHDFIFFKKNGSFTKNNIRKIYKCFAYKNKNFTIISIKGNGFLRSQIRMIISASLKFEKNQLSKQELKEQLLGQNQYTSKLLEPQGLYLSRIYY